MRAVVLGTESRKNAGRNKKKHKKCWKVGAELISVQLKYVKNFTVSQENAAMKTNINLLRILDPIMTQAQSG